MRYNHIILTGRDEGWSGSEGKRCLLFLDPVTLTTKGDHSVSPKNPRAGLFQGSVIYTDVLILFPTSPAAAVRWPALLFYSLRSQRRRHLEAIAVAKESFVKGSERRGGLLQRGYRTVSELMRLAGQEAATEADS